MHDVTGADRQPAACDVSGGLVGVFGILALVSKSGVRTQAPGRVNNPGAVAGSRSRNQAALSMDSGCGRMWSGGRV